MQGHLVSMVKCSVSFDPVAYQELFFCAVDGVALIQNSRGLHCDSAVRDLELHTMLLLFPLLTPPRPLAGPTRSYGPSPAQFLLQAGRRSCQLIHGQNFIVFHWMNKPQFIYLYRGINKSISLNCKSWVWSSAFFWFPTALKTFTFNFQLFANCSLLFIICL